jgi:N-acetylglucosaminyldiphosphoundecaprenol N-acetyl-beta-D-mannosaminyltransferase
VELSPEEDFEMATEVLVEGGSPSLPSLEDAATTLESDESRQHRVELGGILVDPVNLPGAIDRIEHFVRSGQPHQVVTVNLDFISIACRNRDFLATLNGADLAVADGMPLVWLSRLKGEALQERVAGVDLVHESCRLAADLDASVFLLGATPGVAETAGRTLTSLHPGLRIAGTYSPPVGPLSPSENQHIVRLVRQAAPDFLFVALGAPRQDLWIREHQAELQVPVAMGVGCVLDLLAGNVQRAPLWMQRHGLEWAFRLGQEPQRLWRRYLLNDLPMLARLALGGGAPIPDALAS